MQTKFSRRTIVKGGLTVGAFVPAFAFFAGNANAAGLPPLDVGDPYQGKASDATAGCNIFAGHSVPAAGWCKVWAQKPGA